MPKIEIFRQEQEMILLSSCHHALSFLIRLRDFCGEHRVLFSNYIHNLWGGGQRLHLSGPPCLPFVMLFWDDGGVILSVKTPLTPLGLSGLGLTWSLP